MCSLTCKAPEGEKQQNKEPTDADNDHAQRLNEAVLQRLEGSREILDLRPSSIASVSPAVEQLSNRFMLISSREEQKPLWLSLGSG